MFDLIFFSTNRAKIAHFRHLGDEANIRIKSFKEVNYYGSYEEPRIDERAELLKRSYASALEKWLSRQRSDDSTSTFFLEDTSVRIQALSGEKETPGVNIKYWMREISFSKLDEILKRSGNDRRASVRSDIIIHLPRKWKELLATKDDYVWVHGEIFGHIVDVETEIEANLVYPWLDDKSFNRWFVPDGQTLPLSALSIRDADSHDFRRKAFEQVLTVLSRLQLLRTVRPGYPTQLDLPRIQSVPSIFIVCGPTCAGKTTAAGWLTDTYGIPHIEASDFMYKAFWERHGLRSKVRIGNFAEAALQTKPGIVAIPIARHIINQQMGTAVVTGFRAPEEIELFRANLDPGMKVELIYLEADHETRMNRAIARNRDEVTPEKFDDRCDQEERMGIIRISSVSDVTKFNNDGPLRRLFASLAKKYHSAFSMQIVASSDARFETSLERFILMTLRYSMESNAWLTTTEIAAALNLRFGVKKSKNNVSRYFNQEFHPFFEVRLRDAHGRKTNTIEYQLSPTGISAAKVLAKAHLGWLSSKKIGAKQPPPQLELNLE